jgi:hypothetical protein
LSERIANIDNARLLTLGSMTSAEDQAAVLEEIRLTIIEAARERDIIRADSVANFIAAAYPLSHLSIGEISARIVEAALAAGVQVEIRSAGRDEHSVRLSLPESPPGDVLKPQSTSE